MDFSHFDPFDPLLLVIPLAILAISVICVRSTLDWRSRSRGLPLPPGPRPWFILGNLFDMPKLKPWFGFRELCAQHGGLVYLRAIRQHIIVIGSASLAKEFLEKQSAISSDKPLNLAITLSGQDYNFAFMPYGQWWRSHRRVFWQHFHPGVGPKYRPAQQASAHKFISRLLESPSRLKGHIRSLVLGLMLQVVYDIDITKAREDLIRMLDDGLEALSLATPGRFAVETFPFLRHVPAWFPGAGFQRLFANCRAANDRLKHTLFDELAESLSQGQLRSCIAAEMLSRTHTDIGSRYTPEEQKDLLKNVCTVAIEAGADTTFSVLQAVFVGLALYPEAQKRAQIELDMVVGSSRLPDYKDMEALVYVNALIKESLRWHSGVPLGTPHRVTRDDEFHGYFIPEGTTIIPNVWEMMHDPEAYADPFAFLPERFIREEDGQLDPTIRDPTLFMFGFGRRVCPGRYFAIDALFITIASVLHVFNIGLPLDEDGHPIQIKYEQTHGLLSYPEDCRCSIQPRSAETLALIHGL